MSDRKIVPDREALENCYRKREDSYYSALRDISRQIEKELAARKIRASLKIRVKSFESYFKKTLLRMRENSGNGIITDILGIRIVCPFLENLNEAEEVLRDLFNIIEKEIKGDKHSFREFGYEATHLLVSLPSALEDPEGKPLECAEVQIRTILQDAWAEVEHELVYKAGFNPFDMPLKRKLAALNANLTLSDIIFQEIRDYQRQLKQEILQRREAFSKTVSERTLPKTVPAGYPRLLRRDDADSEDVLASASSLDDLLLQGLLAHNSGYYEKAIKIYTRLLLQDDKKIKSLVYVHRGMAFFAESKYETALADFNEALEINPQSARTLYLRGVTYRMLDRLPEALADLRKAIALDPHQAEYWFAKAQLYFHSGDYLAARQDCESAVRLEPDSKELEQFMQLLKEKSRL